MLNKLQDWLMNVAAKWIWFAIMLPIRITLGLCFAVDMITKFLSIKLSIKDIIVLEKVIRQYMLEQEALAYKDTKDIDAYTLHKKIKNIIALYDL